MQTARARVLVALSMAAVGTVLESTPKIIKAYAKTGEVDPDPSAVEFALSENAPIVRHGLPEPDKVDQVDQTTTQATDPPPADQASVDQAADGQAQIDLTAQAADPSAEGAPSA